MQSCYGILKNHQNWPKNKKKLRKGLTECQNFGNSFAFESLVELSSFEIQNRVELGIFKLTNESSQIQVEATKRLVSSRVVELLHPYIL